MLCRLIIALWALAVPALAVELPSCEADTEQYCLGDDKDMSPEGIDACLTALADRSQRCTDYLALLEACKADISGDGICAAAHGDGETVPCLVQRTKPESLSESCQGALPKNEVRSFSLSPRSAQHAPHAARHRPPQHADAFSLVCLAAQRSCQVLGRWQAAAQHK